MEKGTQYSPHQNLYSLSPVLYHISFYSPQSPQKSLSYLNTGLSPSPEFDLSTTLHCEISKEEQLTPYYNYMFFY
jgi:hypothetical protein